MDIKTEVIYDSGTHDFCFSLKKQQYIELDGKRHDIGQPERIAVCPGDFNIIAEFAPMLSPVFQALWTQSFIDEFKAKKAVQSIV